MTTHRLTKIDTAQINIAPTLPGTGNVMTCSLTALGVMVGNVVQGRRKAT
jgi:hypothetical protein